VQYAGRITVEDPRGRRLQVNEYRGRRFFKHIRRFVLETGEPVKRITFDHYQVESTGEPLARVTS